MTILVTGGTGAMASIIKASAEQTDYLFMSKPNLDVRDYDAIMKLMYLYNAYDIKTILHLGAMTHPMEDHESDADSSIENNIIGTANIARVCDLKRIKMIYASTDWVYSGFIGPYAEEDPTVPVTNYGWSKLGGECAVNMVDNHLILRMSATRRPFVHPAAFTDVKKSLIGIEECVAVMLKAIELGLTGTYNIGGPETTIYDFAKKDKPDVKKCSRKDVEGLLIPQDTTMNCNKIRKYLPGYDKLI
jgi:dTDP-4-dehydrorhamnose reductase